MRIVGVDLGGTHVRAAAVDEQGVIQVEDRAKTPESGPGSLLDTIVQLVRGLGPVAALGIGVAALVDRDGVARYAPNIPGLVDVPIGRQLADALRAPVAVDNDANVAAWGELTFGAAQGVHHGLVVTLGTGVGGGIIVDGSVYRGAHGFAGEIGHWPFDPHGPRCACGEVGHWEAQASGTALGALARRWTTSGRAPAVTALAGGDPSAVEGIHVSDAALAGDDEALAILAEYSRRVAKGLAGLANILDPEVIVISGGLIDLGAVLLDPIRSAFASHLEGAPHRPEIPIVAARLGEQAGVVGASVIARRIVAGSGT